MYNGLRHVPCTTKGRWERAPGYRVQHSYTISSCCGTLPARSGGFGRRTLTPCHHICGCYVGKWFVSTPSAAYLEPGRSVRHRPQVTSAFIRSPMPPSQLSAKSKNATILFFFGGGGSLLAAHDIFSLRTHTPVLFSLRTHGHAAYFNQVRFCIYETTQHRDS